MNEIFRDRNAPKIGMSLTTSSNKTDRSFHWEPISTDFISKSRFVFLDLSIKESQFPLSTNSIERHSFVSNLTQ